jgi:hypothetical protein
MKAFSVVLSLMTVLLVVVQSKVTAGAPFTCPESLPTKDLAAQRLADSNAAYEAGDLATAELRSTEIRRCAAGTVEWPKAVFNLGLLELTRKNFPRAIAYFDLPQPSPRGSSKSVNSLASHAIHQEISRSPVTSWAIRRRPDSSGT